MCVHINLLLELTFHSCALRSPDVLAEGPNLQYRNIKLEILHRLACIFWFHVSKQKCYLFSPPSPVMLLIVDSFIIIIIVISEQLPVECSTAH